MNKRAKRGAKVTTSQAIHTKYCNDTKQYCKAITVNLPPGVPNLKSCTPFWQRLRIRWNCLFRFCRWFRRDSRFRVRHHF
ncbi:hypothetical protein AC249_AIPGENE15381 [Exaiptasia diaphana]|nr:hypothetical protein AC249_AIPGENE15381 [Exaiptasia diaphana]